MDAEGAVIIWSGWGVLTVLIGIVGAVAGQAGLQPVIMRLGPALPPDTGLAVGLLLAAVVNWLVARRLSSRPGRELIDAQTGQRVVLRRRNTLFFIPMHYWSALLLLIAVAALFAPAPDGLETNASLSRPLAG